MSDRNIKHRHDTNVAIQECIYKMNHNSVDACVCLHYKSLSCFI